MVGQKVEDARALPEVEGVFAIVEEDYEYSSEYEEGVIIKQSPDAGVTRKSPNGELITINVTVSQGARSGTMPNLIGQESRAARLVLEQDDDLDDLNLVIVEGRAPTMTM